MMCDDFKGCQRGFLVIVFIVGLVVTALILWL